MDSAEFAGWQVFHALEPFGSPTDDGRFGVVATAAYAAWGGKRDSDEWFNRYTPPHVDPEEDLRAVLASLKRQQEQAADASMTGGD